MDEGEGGAKVTPEQVERVERIIETWRAHETRRAGWNFGEDADALSALLAERERLRGALGSLRRTAHHECEDCWFSCPKHPDYCGNDDRSHCSCGHDSTNAEIDAALAAPADAAPPPYPEFCRHRDRCAGLSCCPRDPTCAD
jgi:hypothetical protein